MHKPFHPTPLSRFLNRDRLRIGRGTQLARTAVFSINSQSHISIGIGCRINHGAILATHGGFIEVGNHVGINPYTILYGHGGLRIGNDTRIAAHCVIIPANHNFSDPECPIRQQGNTKRGIVIGRDVWIGANCTILDGANIVDGCVIAAGSVVRGSTEPYCVYGGVPARRLKARGEETALRVPDEGRTK